MRTRFLVMLAWVLAACGGGPDPFALQDAAQFNALAQIEQRARAGQDVGVRDDAGYTPLHVAGSARVGRLLIELGAPIDARAADGVTPLLAATIMGRVGLVQLLISRGAQLEARGPGGFRALHQAAAGEDIRVLRALLRAGADRRARTETGETALALARRFGNRAAERELQRP